MKTFPHTIALKGESLAKRKERTQKPTHRPLSLDAALNCMLAEFDRLREQNLDLVGAKVQQTRKEGPPRTFVIIETPAEVNDEELIAHIATIKIFPCGFPPLQLTAETYAALEKLHQRLLCELTLPC